MDSGPATSLIAVASSDGVSIDLQLGQAGEFLLYEVVDRGEYRRVGSRQFPGYGEFFRSPLAASLLLGDVTAILVNRINRRVAEKFRRRGIMVFAVTGSIDRALTRYARLGSILTDDPLRPLPTGSIRHDRHDNQP